MFSRYQRTLQDQDGYTRDDGSGYQGSPVRYYQRIRYRSNHLSLNLTQEKDPGEPLSGPAGFDFNSLHFAVEDAGNLQMLVVDRKSTRLNSSHVAISYAVLCL